MKKILFGAVILCLATLLLAGSAVASEPEIWDGTVAESFAGGSGTPEDPYLICNGAQLALIEQYSYGGFHFKIVADIYLNDTADWKSWTAENRPANHWIPLSLVGEFSGVLNGAGHTIYGMYATSDKEYGNGLICATGGAVIENLSIERSAVFGQHHVGLLVGKATNTTVRNCHVAEGLSSATGSNVGGLIGNSHSDRIVDCTNTATIYTSTTSYNACGGIVGYASATVVERCTNFGEITGCGYKNGGIVGFADAGTQIIACENHRSFEADCDVGGIAGDIEKDVSVLNCKNYAAISSKTYRVGGIVGMTGDATAEIRNCENHGAISGTEWGVGGVVGALHGGTVSGSTNTATVSSAGSNIGGIVGTGRSGCVSGCTNAGCVSTTGSNAGGVAGDIREGAIANCTNAGSIIAQEGGAGGIVGHVYEAVDGVANCINLGSVIGWRGVAGICGDGRAAKIRNCLHFGTVTSENGPYGAVCGNDRGSTLENCFAIGIAAGAVDVEMVTEVDESQIKTPAFLQTLNTWVQTYQRPATGYAFWETDADGYPVPTGEIPAYVPVVGNLTLTQPENGSAILSADSAWTETEVTVTVTADAGYIPYQVWYCAVEAPSDMVFAKRTGNNTFVFSMPYGDAEVYATCLALPENLTWDGTVADAFTGGDGSENNPYLIGNGAQLALLKNYTNQGKFFRLIADIYLNDSDNWEGWTAENSPANVWEPISYFKGTLDGDGYTIYGLYTDATKSNQGLFNQIQDGAALKNLTIDQSKLFGTEWIGPFAGSNCGTISNCINYAQVTASGRYSGGITGRSNSSDSIVEDCINYGTITSFHYSAAGIIGNANCIVRNCINYGSVSSTFFLDPNSPSRSMPVAGIAGGGDQRIENCKNYGEVTGYRVVGGIVGSYTGTIDGCANYANITALFSAENERSGESVGGIVASAGGDIVVSNCVNTGAVSGQSNVGGICGLVGYDDQFATGHIAKCTNKGAVYAEQSTAAGIVACINGSGNNSIIEQCVNDGSVAVGSNGYYAGGLVGYLKVEDGAASIVRNCSNTASVTGDWSGGLVAEVRANTDDASVLIEACYSSGTVSGVQNISGTVGRIRTKAAGAEIMVRNCYTLATAATATVEKSGGPGTETVTNVNALTAAQMGRAANFEGFDFDTVWYSAGDGTYPTLRTEQGSGTLGDVAEFTVYQSGRVVVTAETTLLENAYVLAVSYQNGKMVDCAMVLLNPGQTKEMLLEELGDEVRLMALSGQYLPMCASQPSTK